MNECKSTLKFSQWAGCIFCFALLSCVTFSAFHFCCSLVTVLFCCVLLNTPSVHTLSSPLTTEYLALAAHLFHHPCQHSCHVAEHWAEKSPAVPSHAPSSPPLSFAARSACPPPGDHQPCKKTQKKDIRLSDSRQNNTEDFQKVSSHLTVLSHELYWFTYNQAEDKQTCWTRDSLLSSDCSSSLLALSSSCPIWGQWSKNNLHEQVFQNLNSIRV